MYDIFSLFVVIDNLKSTIHKMATAEQRATTQKELFWGISFRKRFHAIFKSLDFLSPSMCSALSKFYRSVLNELAKEQFGLVFPGYLSHGYLL